MKTLLTLSVFGFMLCTMSAQTAANDQELVPMSDTYQKAYKLGSVYYKTGTKTPFTGILYGKYSNGNYQTMQELMVLVMVSGLIIALKALKNVKAPIRITVLKDLSGFFMKMET